MKLLILFTLILFSLGLDIGERKKGWDPNYIEATSTNYDNIIGTFPVVR